MVAATRARQATPEDLLRDRELKNFELVNGHLVEKDVSLASSYIAGLLHHHASSHVNPKKLGWCFPDNTSIQCYAEEPSRVRKPDFVFVRAGRLKPEDLAHDGHLRIVPDVVAEVVSPNDLAYEVAEKVREYQRAGVRLVWVVWPHTKSVDVHQKGGPNTSLNLGDDLDGGPAIPGFKLPLADLFAEAAG